jgi:hypothetical protein
MSRTDRLHLGCLAIKLTSEGVHLSYLAGKQVLHFSNGAVRDVREGVLEVTLLLRMAPLAKLFGQLVSV